MKKDNVSSYSLYAADRHPTDRCPGFLTDLILRCAAGEEAALGSLFDHLSPMVASIVGGAALAVDADDLVLAVFGRVWRQSPMYDPKVWESVAWVVFQARSAVAELEVGVPPEGPTVLTC